MKKIGFIGLGIMGESMCENLVKKSGLDVYCYDLNKEQVKKLEAIGAVACSFEDIAKCDYIFTTVPTSKNVREVYTDLLPLVRENTILIDMSTIEPSVTKELEKLVKSYNCEMLDAPVVKSKPAAINGTLGIYVGGNYDKYEEVLPLLKCMGANIIHLGEIGNGISMKICHNMLVSQIQNGVNEMLLLANKCGIDLDKAIEAISYGGGQNFYLDGKKSAILNNNYAPAFSVQNMHKDIHIATELGDSLNIDLKGAKVAQEVYDEAVKDYLKEDFSATYKTVNRIRG